MKKIDNNFIPYKQSIELEKLGFCQDCFAWYNSSGVLIISLTEKESANPEVLIHAPLYQQAFNWIRENYELCTFVNFSGLKYCSGWEDRKFKEYGYKTYETFSEAELGCLNSLIKHIKKIQDDLKSSIDIDSKEIEYSKLNTEDVQILINCKLTKKIDLSQEELKYLSQDLKDNYINTFIKSGYRMDKWLWDCSSRNQRIDYIDCRISNSYKLKDYELEYASELQKIAYEKNINKLKFGKSF